MYSLDVNLLKDRSEFKKGTVTDVIRSRWSAGNWSRVYFAIGLALVLPGLAGCVLLFLQSQNSQLETKIAGLDSQLSSLGIEEQQLQKLQEQANAIKSQNQALASVFNQIRPWSAMLQDLRDRIPAEVQIQSLKQTTPPAPAPPASTTQNSAAQKSQTPPPPTSGVEISGMANSFSGVNDFLLTLQQSPFFKPQETKIVKAELVDGPTPVSQPGKPVQKPSQFVKYTMQTSLSNIPASELIGELEQKGTSGLVTRIRTLQERGIIQR
ncbi:MAG: PilN domain-containing protein [Chroococcidiopsidaceae cyanobacterium CP_BM_ER_R8_30]|nr:PilN domain-containing protein [Chroococcidiopsidaceae cyanobacterium CP_BM_ER_R8_30]